MFLQQERFEEALDCYQEDLIICRQIGDRPGESTTLNNLGLVYSKIHREQDAIECYEQGLQISRELGDRDNLSYLLSNLGALHLALGQIREAKTYTEQNLSNLSRIRGSCR